MVHEHSGDHDEKCTAKNGINYVKEIDIEKGIGVEIFKEEFRQFCIALAIDKPILNGTEIWKRARDHFVKNARMGSVIPKTKEASNYCVTLLYISRIIT